MLNSKLKEKKIDAHDLAIAISKLPEDKKLIIYGMVKGIELVNGKKKESA